MPVNEIPLAQYSMYFAQVVGPTLALKCLIITPGILMLAGHIT